MSNAPGNQQPRARRLRIWQQNLNKSLQGQIDMLQSLKPKKYDLALIQEPNIDFRNKSRTNLCFTAVYPALHDTDPKASRSLILVNTHLPSSSWSVIPLPSSDITAVELRTSAHTIRIINIYNDCEHNDAL
ncbi:hypothetical protein B0H11DRAFT_1766002, partial [Mycena galericulata]